MEFTVWEESQRRRNTTDFVDPWDSNRPFDPDTGAAYEELDPHDTGSPSAKTLGANSGEFRGDPGDRSFYFDDPAMHAPSSLRRDEFLDPDDIQDDARNRHPFDEGEPLSRGHKRELSEAFTMRYPLVSPTHADSVGHIGPQTLVHGGDTSPDLTANMMRTPVRDFSHYPFDAMRMRDSPTYGAAGLDSPLESPALQSPYMSGQPFPALPRVQEHHAPHQKHPNTPAFGPASPQSTGPSVVDIHGSGGHSGSAKSNRKAGEKYTPTSASRSSSGSLSSNLSAVSMPQNDEQQAAKPVDGTPDRGPQTPRVSSSKTRSKARRTPTSATPKAGESGAASTPTPAQDGRRDSRKRIAKEQIEILEAFFHQNPRPEREDRMRLSSETNLEPRTVQIWFQNRRAKSRSMKMPPSQADNSLFAQQYRAAAAAASQAAAAAAGAQPAYAPQGQIPMDRSAAHGDPWTLQPGQRMVIPGGGPRQMPNYGVFQPQQRVYPAHGSPPPHGPHMGRYHQQLGGKQMYSPGPHGISSAPTGMHGGVPVHSMQQVPNMAPNHGPANSQLMPAMPHMGHGRSASSYEPFVNNAYHSAEGGDFEVGFDPSMMYATKTGSTASLTSIGSSFGMPQSPLNSEALIEGQPPMYSPNMNSLQNSPVMNSPMTAFPSFAGGHSHGMSEEPAQLSRSQSAYSFGDAWQHTGPAVEMKRRRSLYGAVPTWGWADHNPATHTHISPSRTPSMSSTTSSSGSANGTLAASAAAAALRTRNRSSTQPAPRSRQPSIRLQLDESNHSATLVVLPQESETPHDAGSEPANETVGKMTPRGSKDLLKQSSREMSPERAERAAERLLAERAAAATMGARPSPRSSEK